MKISITIGILLSYSLLSTQAYAQGRVDGFYRGQHNATVVLGLGFEDGQEYFAGVSGDLDLTRSVFYSSLSGIYGITNTTDVSVSIPYIVSDDNANFQDIAIYLKQQIIVLDMPNASLQMSLAAGFSTNMTDYDLGGLNDIGQQATIYDFRGMIHYQTSQGWFATVQSGYSIKSSVTPDSMPFVIKIGKAMKDWYFDGYFDYQDSRGGIDYRGTPRPQDFRALGVDYSKVGGTVYKPIAKEWGAYISLSYVLEGRNIFRGPGYGLGVVYNFSLQ